MSKNNLFKLMFVALVSFAATAFVGCTDNDDNEIKAPTLVASPMELNLSEESPRGTVDIQADCQWSVNAPTWVDVTPANGRGSMTIEVSVDPEIVQEAKSGNITFTLFHDTYGEWGKAESKVKVVYTYNGQTVEPGKTGELVYGNNFGDEAATKEYGNSGSSWPYLDQYDGWKNEEGSGAGNVTYLFSDTSIRANSPSDGNYSDYEGSGGNNLFFGSSAYFTIENISLNTNKLQLQFGSEKYSQDGDSNYNPDEMLVTLSADGQSWSNPITYAFPEGADMSGRWNVATADFTLPEGTTTLYIKYTATVASVYRVDDIKLFEGEGGQQITFDGTVTPPTPTPEDAVEVTVAEFLAAAEDDTLYQLTGEIKGTYNTSYGHFYLKDDTGEVLIYGLLTPDGESQKQYQAAGLKDGDIITLYGKRGSHNNNPQMKNATYISHVAGEGGGTDDPVVPAEGPYASDAPFVCSTDDSTNAAYGHGDTTIDGNAVTGFKLGKSKQAGKFTSGAVGVSGDKYLNFYAVGWKGGDVTLYFRVDGGATQSQKLAANDGATGNTPYTALSFASTDHYSILLTGLTATSTIEFSTDANFELTTATQTMPSARAIVCGVKLTDEPLSPEQGGEEPEPDPEQPTGVVTIAEILALGQNAAIESAAIEGVVISNMALNNLTSKKGLYVQDATGGLQFYMAANHEFAFGDKVKIDLSGTTLGDYNGAVQISGLAVEKVEVLSSGNTVEAKTVTMADFLANKYEGQYIALEGVQVASADLAKTWVADSKHTSITMEDANGNSFVVFSSKYATYGAETVVQGSGTLKGISSINNGALQIIFAQASDYAGLTGERFGATEPEPDPEPEQPTEVIKATVAEFLAAEVSSDVWYELTGVVRNVANTTYGNFDLVDESGTVYVYGLTATKVDSNDKSFSTLGIDEYDTVTLIGTRAAYGETPQVDGPAYYVSHVKGEAPELPANVAVISFDDVANRTSYTTEQQVWAQNGITVTNDKGASSSNVGDYYGPARFYQSSNLTISAEKAMSKIVFNATGSKFLNLSDGEGYTVEGSGTATTTITLDPAVTSFTITGLANQVRVTSIEVTFAE